MNTYTLSWYNIIMRNIRVIVLLTDEEKAEFERQAATCGLPLSTFIRLAAKEKVNASSKD
jgi:hypothetical protein